MQLLPKITLTLILCLAPALSFATEAKVIVYGKDCGYLVLEAKKGYLLLKQQGSSSYKPKKDDKVDGFQIEKFGVSHLRKLPSGEVMWVFNQYTWLSKKDAKKHYAEYCKKA